MILETKHDSSFPKEQFQFQCSVHTDLLEMEMVVECFYLSVIFETYRISNEIKKILHRIKSKEEKMALILFLWS